MANAAPQQAPPTTRMSLGQVVKGRQEVPDRVLIYGVEGVGKSSWAGGAPSPVFVDVEGGTAQLEVERFPTPTRWTWRDILDAVEALRVERHNYKTVVFDTLDAIEPLLWKHICERDGKSSVEDYGYGKGYSAALDEWRIFLSELERLRRERSIGVVLVAHSVVRTFKNPAGEDYDRYELKLNPKAGGLAKEWCDSVLFAHHETHASKEKKSDHRAKGFSTGARIVSTQREAAFDAKNRYGLPQTLPLAYEEYSAAVKLRRPEAVVELKASIAKKLALVTDAETKKKCNEFVAKAGDDAVELAKADNRLTALTTKES